MNPNKSFASQSEQVSKNHEAISDDTSWQNPGEFPPFDSEAAAREKARTVAEMQYRSELSRPYEQNRDGITRFALESEDGQIDGYEFAGADFKMLVSVVNAIGRSLEKNPQEFDIEKWVHDKREHISTSLISDNKIHLVKTDGPNFGFNNLDKDDFLSAAPADHGILRDVGQMGQYKDTVMSPDELIEATGSGLTAWNEVEIRGDVRPDSIIVFGDNMKAIMDRDKELAKYFGVPIYLIRTDIYGKPKGKHDVKLSEEVERFWEDREKPISGRAEQTRGALLDEAKSYYETGELGEFMTKYLGEFDDKIQYVKEKSANQDEFVKNLISELGEENMAHLGEHIADGD